MQNGSNSRIVLLVLVKINNLSICKNGGKGKCKKRALIEWKVMLSSLVLPTEELIARKFENKEQIAKQVR